MGRKRANADAAAQREWELGIDWARWLIDGNTPRPLQVYGVVLEPGEVAYLQTTAQYSRLYGGDGRYRQSGGFFIGNPTLVVGMMAANAALNAGRKAAAKRDLQPSWRDLQEVPVLATNLRLMCNLPQKGWMSFYYSAVQEFYPDTANWMITFGFQNAVPLRIAGLTTPTLAVLTAWCVHGNGRWQGEPGIAPLLQAALGARRADPGNEVHDSYPHQLSDESSGTYATDDYPSRNEPSSDYPPGEYPPGDPWGRDPWE
ncbi:hypothetical protein GCM10009630_41680 [Kribbella jejuensis]|uniref:Uncharacterized protein n=1 Tax=Kribbella jejuensis TaxID=236068 RepID=A0A542EQL4_9ACTN|nr:hypothetical protein [Kribbella jejuensis]TQJ17609.1 hypothetical protein FB475_1732 [Kribbella jejuensis]